ncbi:MAG: DUF1501 domain-containing protein, partial [Acidimicrobiia bacterium]|nr:DUF1501 domain-containing protein [Acidimicrobiia bacterium]
MVSSGWSSRHAPSGHGPRNVSLSLGGSGVRILLTGYRSSTGGTKPGFSYGETDEFGHHAVAGKVHMHDWHATLLHLLGMDHEKLTFMHNGRPFRLTDVH